MWVLLIVMAALAGGIIFVANRSAVPKKDRKGRLQELARFVEGRMEEIPGKRACYRVAFDFEGYPFVFEDLVEQGMDDLLNRAFLKVPTKARFSLDFTEKERTLRITADVVIVSEIKDAPIVSKIKVVTPPALGDLEIFTDDPAMVNEFFKRRKIVKIFQTFQNKDNRGFVFNALRIKDGMVMLEFYANSTFQPNLDVFWHNIYSIEDYAEKLLFVAKTIDRLVQDREEEEKF